MAALTIAAAQYPIETLADLASFEMKLSRWVSEAVESGANLIVFPEHTAMELANTFGPDVAGDLATAMIALQEVLPEVDALHAALSRRHRVHILAGSAPVRQTDGRFIHTARLFAPSSGVGVQEKLILSPDEREMWRIEPGRGLRVFVTSIGQIAVAIGYDAEFPLLVRALVNAGAEVILVPSCTVTLAGYHRVRIACAARALESQCYVVQSSALGRAPWLPDLAYCVGAAGVFAPPDAGYPDDGVMARGRLDEPGWIHASLDLEHIDAVRLGGETRNFEHWQEQPGVGPSPEAERIKLS